MELQTRRRGRPTGSRKSAAELRQRRDYRFSPATLHQIEQGRQLVNATETAFLEEAIGYYVDFLTNKEADIREMEQIHAHIQELERQLAEAHTVQQFPQFRQAIRQQEPVPPSSDAPASSPLPRRPTYQIYFKHEQGPCPHLPEGFAYIDMHKSIDPRQCPIHRVFARPCAIAIARERVEQIKREVPEIIQVWLDKDGYGLPRDSWRKEHGRWIRDD
ncbi:MAG: hypothetical protein WCD86_17060 [Ktedonobacteraceae bacterium]